MFFFLDEFRSIVLLKMHAYPMTCIIIDRYDIIK